MSTARVDFTRGAAERIARAVRIVEQGERDQTGPRYGIREEAQVPPIVRYACWSADWTRHSTVVIRLASAELCGISDENSQAPDEGDCACPGNVNCDPDATTAIAYNIFLGVGPGHGAVLKCQTPDFSGWHLISADLTKQPGWQCGVVKILGSDADNICRWYQADDCPTDEVGPQALSFFI